MLFFYITGDQSNKGDDAQAKCWIDCGAKGRLN